MDTKVLNFIKKDLKKLDYDKLKPNIAKLNINERLPVIIYNGNDMKKLSSVKNHMKELESAFKQSIEYYNLQNKVIKEHGYELVITTSDDYFMINIVRRNTL